MEKRKLQITNFTKLDYLCMGYRVNIPLDGFIFPTALHMYQCAKSANPEDWKLILANSDPNHAMEMGQKIIRKSNWNTIKIPVMQEVIKLKFKQDFLIWRLWETRDYEIIWDNPSNTFWGQTNGIGENHLGKIIVQHREVTWRGIK